MVRVGGFAVPENCKLFLLDSEADAFGGDDSLRESGVEQKRRKFFAAKTRCNIAAAQLRDAIADFFERPAAGQMSVSIVDVLKKSTSIIKTQNGRFSGGAGGFASQFRKKRAARKQSG